MADAGDQKPGFKAVEQNDRNSLNMEVDSQTHFSTGMEFVKMKKHSSAGQAFQAKFNQIDSEDVPRFGSFAPKNVDTAPV